MVTDLRTALAAYTSGILRSRAAYAAEHPTTDDLKAARAERDRRRKQERKDDRG